MKRQVVGAHYGLRDWLAQRVTAVVMAVERAQLAMQLASQIRNKLVEDYQDIFRMQV